MTRYQPSCLTDSLTACCEAIAPCMANPAVVALTGLASLSTGAEKPSEVASFPRAESEADASLGVEVPPLMPGTEAPTKTGPRIAVRPLRSRSSIQYFAFSSACASLSHQE